MGRALLSSRAPACFFYHRNRSQAESLLLFEEADEGLLLAPPEGYRLADNENKNPVAQSDSPQGGKKGPLRFYIADGEEEGPGAQADTENKGKPAWFSWMFGWQGMHWLFSRISPP